jgi:hypothetical protein
MYQANRLPRLPSEGNEGATIFILFAVSLRALANRVRRR